jgi:2-polyprenyl-3-methyl-5-hydroxy-6-metoxy-1,4-benzoquinol methylase
MFRVPKDELPMREDFYESRYQQGFTTDCPSPDILEKLKQTRFAGTEKDYAGYIDFIQAAGITPGMSVLDFGCSWGYGSWQLQQAGYDVYSCETARTRGRYAEEMLACKLISPERPSRQFDCFFSAHVLEHLSNPRYMWELAHRALRPGGLIVAFLPNGSLSQPKVHKLWGKVHPLLIDSEALLRIAEWAGFSGVTYTSPYNLQHVSRQVQSAELSGDELAIVGSKLPIKVGPSLNNS